MTDATRALRFLSFNIRCDTPADGENQWLYRKEAVAAFLAERRPDVAGLQEALPHQLQFVRERLAQYEAIGTGRDHDGGGEHTPLLYRPDRLRVVQSGTFWLSETPHVPGSMSWETACPRIATWAIFGPARPGGEGAQPEILVVNTHLDHRSQAARENGAALVMQFIEQTAGGRPVVVMGDMNGAPTNPAVQRFLSGAAGLVDTLVASGKARPGEAGPGTFHGFRGAEAAVSRIDYIFASAVLPVRAAGVLYDRPGGRWLSDHFPVEAELAWEPAPA